MDSHSDSRLATTLNNDAVYYMHAGKHEKALSTLSGALHASRRVMQRTRDVDDDSNDEMILSLDDLMAKSRVVDDHNGSSRCDDVDDNKVDYMYKRPVHIPSDIPQTYEANLLVSIVIIFNLALAYQLATTSSSCGDEIRIKSRLRKSAKLYELAHNLHCEENLHSATFVMACVNNLGLIHLELNNAKSAEKCFEHLLSTLMFLVDCGDSGDSKLDGFFRNASHLLGQPSAASAA